MLYRTHHPPTPQLCDVSVVPCLSVSFSPGWVGCVCFRNVQFGEGEKNLCQGRWREWSLTQSATIPPDSSFFSLCVYPNRIGHRPQKQSQRLRWEEEGGGGGAGISLHIHPSLSRLFVSHPCSFSKRRGGEAGTNSLLLFLHLSPLLRSFHETERGEEKQEEEGEYVQRKQDAIYLPSDSQEKKEEKKKKRAQLISPWEVHPPPPLSHIPIYTRRKEKRDR